MMRLATAVLAILAVSVSSVAAFAAGKPPITTGNKIPLVELDWGFPPQKVNLPQYCMGRSVIIVGLPGAFTPTWCEKLVPGYLEHEDALKESLGVDEVLFYSVNDGAVMKAWFLDQKLEGTMMQMMGDPSGEFTRECGMELVHPGPQAKGLYGRCKRFAMYVVNCVVQYAVVSESEDDPAGDDFPEATCAPAMIEAIQQVNREKQLLMTTTNGEFRTGERE
jgi:peroxiredoxin